MSTSTFLQLCKDTQASCEISGTSITSVTGQTGILADLVRWVADADVAIQRSAINWDFLYDDTFTVSTVAGTASYNKPSDLGQWDLKTFYLDYTSANYLELTQLDYRDWFKNYGAGAQTSQQPSNFVIRPNKNIILYSQPDAVYTLSAHYWKAPQRMTANTDVSLIPESYIRAIIARAKMYYAIAEEADTVYKEAVSEFNEVMPQLKSDQLPGWADYLISDDVEMTVGSNGDFISDSIGG